MLIFYNSIEIYTDVQYILKNKIVADTESIEYNFKKNFNI